jgi:hypothetical protein
VVLAAGAVAMLAGAGRHGSASSSRVPLGDVARKAGCRVSEQDDAASSNPPTSGRFFERDRVADGSHAGRRPPSLAATIHALYHGRVLIQYRPGLPRRDVERLDRLVSSDPDKVLLFANQTGMRAPVAATAYLSVMTCPRVDSGTLRVLRVFRDRRRGFGQAF